MSEVKTRFAPSPTGYLHVGGARTALFSWLYARHMGGKFVLRIEDTDTERSTQSAMDAIIESMQWLKINWDEGPYYQTKRLERYQEVINKLLEEGKAYKCCCTRERLDEVRQEQMKRGQIPRYDGHCRDAHLDPDDSRPYVVRFKTPREGVTAFDDVVKGHLEFKNSQLDDWVIQRSDGIPTYNFCVVVDDWDMGITHVIRGDDHVNNTPKQINLYHALGAEVPVFCHVAMILGEDGAKLSKRHGAVSVMQYREDGYLPEAVVNYLLRLGFSHGDQEIFSKDEMIALFNLDAISKSASAFNNKKLDWLNAHYMKTLSTDEVASELAWHLAKKGVDLSKGPDLKLVVKAYAERCHTLKEMAEKTGYLFADFNDYDQKGVKKWIKEDSALILQKSCEVIKNCSFTPDELDKALEEMAGQMNIGMGQVGQPLRLALTGTAASPGIGDTLYLVGKERSLERIEKAVHYFGSLKNN